ncbi:MAG: Phospholipase D/Transphosphatidylase [Pedosphaera sp.]|nr:Phospholipase D/Transphosphatidylase [Pedosphaera sp.]
MALSKFTSYKWLRTGDEVFPAMLAAIESAQRSVRCETYIYHLDELGKRFFEALLKAQRRGVKVRVLMDALGSKSLPSNFWQPLQASGGEARWFNPVLLKRFGFRDHRKMLVCDEETAFVGGFNISAEYQGDGVKSGWCDLGLQVTSSLAGDLAAAFDEMFERADLQHKRLVRRRRSSAKRDVTGEGGELLLSGPGRGQNPFKKRLRRDLAKARMVQVIAAYFLPTWRIRHDLIRLARGGCRVQLMLPAKSDVRLSQLACRSLYRRLLKAGVEIYEYQPQILHAKLIVVDDIVYVGSSNLDPRSLYINYELMLRFQNEELAREAKGVFHQKLAHCKQIQLEAWRKSRTWWIKFQQRWAYFLLVRVDPVIARWEYK